jgi:peroxiredoxin Q/BCP
MPIKDILFIVLIVWSFPSTYFRSNFRKIVYQTNDWKINIQPLFKKEIVGLFGNIFPDNKEYIKARNYYRIYLFVYLVLFIVYKLN